MTQVDWSVKDSNTGWIEILPLLALVVAIAVSSTIGVGIADSWFDEQRIIGILALCFAVFVASVFRAGWNPRRASSVVLLAVLASGLISSLLAQRAYVALVEWSLMGAIALLIVGARVSSLRAIRIAGALFGAIVPTAYVAGVVANYVSELLLGFEVGSATLLVGFSNPRFPAQLEALSIPFLFLSWRLAPGPFWRASTTLVAIVWWACLIGSGSRTAWISVAVALLVVAWIERGKGFAFTRFQAVCAALGGIAFIVFFFLLPAYLGLPSATEIDRFSDVGSVGRRAILWKHGLDAVMLHPVVGIGPMHYAYSYNGEGAHPHNFWLQLAAEWGVPVAAVALTAVLVLWRRIVLLARIDHASTEEKEIGVVLCAALTVWLVGTQADGLMVVPTSQLASAVILVLCVAAERRTNTHCLRCVQPASIGLKACWAAVMFIAIFNLSSLMFSSFGNSAERERAWREGKQNIYFHPRFWQQGWIGPDHDVTAKTP